MKRCMWPMTRRAAAIILCVVALRPVAAQTQLVRFRDSGSKHWGYRQTDGRIVIAPRFEGAGVFRNGRAPVRDADGFAIIDSTGRVVDRIEINALAAPKQPIPPPADRCRWPGRTGKYFSFSTVFECYVQQLRSEEHT